MKQLEGKNFNIIPSFINTITIKFSNENEASDFVNKLTKNNILVNQGESDGKIGTDKTFVSFAVGTETQMNKLLTAIT